MTARCTLPRGKRRRRAARLERARFLAANAAFDGARRALARRLNDAERMLVLFWALCQASGRPVPWAIHPDSFLGAAESFLGVPYERLMDAYERAIDKGAVAAMKEPAAHVKPYAVQLELPLGEAP